ncbi:MAG: DUF4383 domain-containing protein [Anaerolineae bacterium]
MKSVNYLFKEMNLIQLYAWIYAAMFIFVVSLGYIPGFTNADGQLFGLFRIDPIDDILHLGSGIWAALAAWTSVRAATLYFKIFGILYGLDGVVGFLLGQGYLDGGIFIYGPWPMDWLTKFAANLPHILIGGMAVVIGFWLSRKLAAQG